MKSRAFIFIAFVLVYSAFAAQRSQYEAKEVLQNDEIKGDEPKHTNSEGYSAGYSHGGFYGGGKICKWGCCSESYGWSHGGGYYGCTCCFSAAHAKAYKEAQAKEQKKN